MSQAPCLGGRGSPLGPISLTTAFWPQDITPQWKEGQTGPSTICSPSHFSVFYTLIFCSGGRWECSATQFATPWATQPSFHHVLVHGGRALFTNPLQPGNRLQILFWFSIGLRHLMDRLPSVDTPHCTRAAFSPHPPAYTMPSVNH